jgi:opacity protein-like surface antigen
MRTVQSVHAKSSLVHRALVLSGLALTVAAVTMLGASSASAQQHSKDLALSGFAGYNVASDLYNGTNSGVTGTASLELKNGFMWGGRVTAFTNPYSAVEFGYARNGSDLSIRTKAGSAIPSGFDAGRVTADEYDLNFLVSQPTSNPKMWPYFTLGLGWSITHPEITPPAGTPAVNIKSNSLFAWNFGVGTMVNVNPKMALRLDARWRVTDTHLTTSSGVYCDYWGYCWTYASSWYNSGEFTAGLTYKLGR